MTHRNARLAIIAAVVLASVTSFLTVKVMDERTALAAPLMVWVNDASVAPNPAATLAAVRAVARERAVNIFRDLPHPDDTAADRHVYLVVGDPQHPSTRWLRSGFPDVSRAVVTTVAPDDQLTTVDPRGFYGVMGTTADAKLLLERLAKLGLVGTVHHTWTFDEFVTGVSPELGLCYLVGLVLILALVAASVILAVRGYAAKRLQGSSRRQLIVDDAIALSRFSLWAVPGTVAVLAGLLWWYNGLAQVSKVAMVTAAALTGYIAAAGATYLLTLAVCCRLPILAQVKGRVPSSWAMAGTYAARISAMVVAITTITGITGLSVHVANTRAAAAANVREPAAAHIIQNGSLGLSEINRLTPTLERQLQGEVNGDTLVLARPDQLPLPGSTSFVTTMTVNRAYLNRNPVRDSAGVRLTQPPADGIDVLIPARLRHQREDIVAALTANLKSMAQSQRMSVPAPRVREIADGQRWYTYGASTLSLRQEYFVRDGVVVVLSGAATGILRLADLATTGAVVLTDPAKTAAAMRTAGLEKLLLNVQPVSAGIQQEMKESAQTLKLQLVTAGLAVLIMSLTGLAASLIYCQHRTQQLFTRFIGGWRLWRSSRVIIGVEVLIALAAIGWTVHTTIDARVAVANYLINPAYREPLALGGWEPAVTAGIMLLGLAGFITILRSTHRRVIRAHGSSLA